MLFPLVFIISKVAAEPSIQQQQKRGQYKYVWAIHSLGRMLGNLAVHNAVLDLR